MTGVLVDDDHNNTTTTTWTSQHTERVHRRQDAAPNTEEFSTLRLPSPVTPSGRTLATDAYDSVAADTAVKSVSVRERSVVAEYHKNLQLL